MRRSLTEAGGACKKTSFQHEDPHASHCLRDLSRREEGCRRDPVAVRRAEARRGLQGSSRGVALKGFRKGKVPRPMLEKMFGRQVEQEVVKQLVQESFVTAAQQHDIQPVAEPIVDDAHLHKGKPFHYSARVEVRSQVEPKDYDGVELGKRAAAGERRGCRRARSSTSAQELTEFKAIEGRAELARRPTWRSSASTAHRRPASSTRTRDGRPRRAGARADPGLRQGARRRAARRRRSTK